MSNQGALLLVQSFYAIQPRMADQQLTRSQTTGTKRTRNSGQEKDSAGPTSRHVVWSETDRAAYVLLRSGIALARREEADRLYDAEELSEAHFFLFEHRDPHQERNALVPKYEAAYYFENTREFAKVKKCHLKAAYQRAGRTAQARIWEVCPETHTPYWVDRHAFSKVKQQLSKRKYEASKQTAKNP